MSTLVITAGCSQSGKNTLISKFLDEFPDARRLPTGTSRAPRTGEIDGVDKIFRPTSEFTDHPEKFLEQVEEHGNHYGIIKQVLIDFLEKYPIVLADIELRGIKELLKHKELLPSKVIVISIHPDNFKTVIARIKKKKDPNEEERIKSAYREWQWKDDSVFTHHVITNDGEHKKSYDEFKKAILG